MRTINSRASGFLFLILLSSFAAAPLQAMEKGTRGESPLHGVKHFFWNDSEDTSGGASVPVAVQPGPTLLTKVLGIGALVAGGYGLYRLFIWATKKSNEDILHEAQKAYATAEAQYRIMYEYMDRTFGDVRSLPSSERIGIIHEMNEPVLYELAIAKYKKESIGSYLAHLKDTLSCLYNHHDALLMRLAEIAPEARCNSAVAHTQERMHVVTRQIEELKGKLQFLYDYLKHHRSYFVVFEAEAVIANRYAKELDILSVYQSNKDALMRELRTCIMSRHSREHTSYPYLSYVNMLDRDLRRLGDAIAGVDYNYQGRVDLAHQLSGCLCTVKDVVVSDPEYLNTVKEYERAQLERQKIEAQKQQAMAQQQQAFAMQQQAQAMQQQANEQKFHNIIMESKIA